MRKIFFVSALLLASAHYSSAQQPPEDKTQMEKEQAELQKEISQIQKDYDKVKRQKKASLGEFNVITRKINLQERYVNSISKELRFIDDDIYLSNIEIYRMQKQLDTLKAQYARSVVYAYKNRSNYDYLNFIFSASSFNDALKRVSYLKRYRSYREQQVADIKETQVRIAQRKQQQLVKKETKNTTLKNQTSQINELAKQKNEKASVVAKLKTQEKDLSQQLAAKKKRDRDIRNAITAVLNRIKREEEIARKKAAKEEADRIAAENKNTVTATNPNAGTPVKPSVTVVKKNTTEFNSAADIKLSGEFAQNKGKLPWPVDNGYISIHFGPYTVEGMNIKDVSPGITIGTTTTGQNVKAVFEGEVVAVHDLGDSKAVFVKHGKYLTSYGKLSSVNVSKGAKVTTGQLLGRTGSADNGEGGQLDFMLLIDNKEQNPESWLRR
jgi:murein hydrolase activator